MGGGSWTTQAYTNYSTSKGRTVSTSYINGVATASLANSNYSTQEFYKASRLDKALDPYKVMRECCDTEEHPETIPVIFGLDVTGSMGSSLELVAKKLNEIMTRIYQEVKDVEFMIMGIGDLYCDNAPIQISQFESDIRIAEQLEKVYFERGGGGNGYESYTAAWYMGSRHCKLDCWKRGKKGIIITLGDEPLNPYLPKAALNAATGDSVEADVETKNLYNEVIEKFDVYHLVVTDGGSSYQWHKRYIETSWTEYLDEEHLKYAKIDNLAEMVSEIITGHATSNDVAMGGELNTISW